MSQLRFFFQERSFSAETASALRYRLLPLQRCRRPPAPFSLQLVSLLEHARTQSQGCSALRDAEACRCRGSPSDGVGGMLARRSRMSSPNFFQGRGDEDTCDRSAFSRLLALTDCRASLCFDCICFSATDVGCESPYSRMSAQACFYACSGPAGTEPLGHSIGQEHDGTAFLLPWTRRQILLALTLRGCSPTKSQGAGALRGAAHP